MINLFCLLGLCHYAFELVTDKYDEFLCLADYAVQLPSLNSSRNGSLGPQGADLDWILAGSGAGGNSARSMRLEDLESTSRQSSASRDGRMHLHSGKKSKLPWDDVQVSFAS